MSIPLETLGTNLLGRKKFITSSLAVAVVAARDADRLLAQQRLAVVAALAGLWWLVGLTQRFWVAP
jgi:hypothetical protein